MKYLCLVYFEPGTLERLAPDEKKQLDRDSLGYDRELERSGHLILAQALESTAAARTVRIRQQKVSVVDGPFAETKEVLAGFVLINARDMEEATAIATKVPLAKLGSVEVRPAMDVRVD